MDKKVLKYVILVLSLVVIILSSYRIYQYFYLNDSSKIENNQNDSNNEDDKQQENEDSFIEAVGSNFYNYVKDEKALSIKVAAYQKNKKLVYNDDIKLEFEFNGEDIWNTDLIIKNHEVELFNISDELISMVYVSKYNQMYLVYIFGIATQCGRPSYILILDNDGKLLKNAEGEYTSYDKIKGQVGINYEIINNNLIEKYEQCYLGTGADIHCELENYDDTYIVSKTNIYELENNSLNLIETKYETIKEYCEKKDKTMNDAFIESKEDSHFYSYVKNDNVLSIKEASYQKDKKLVYNDDIKLEFEFSNNVYEGGINRANIIIKSNDKEIFNGKEYIFAHPIYVAQYQNMYLIYIWGIVDACVTPQAVIAIDNNGNLLKSVNNVEKNDDFDDLVFGKRASKVTLEIDNNKQIIEKFIACGITSPLGVCNVSEYENKNISKTNTYKLENNSLKLIETTYETVKEYCEKNS